MNPVYTPGSADISSGSVILTITAQSFGNCTAVSDATTLHISHQASVSAGVDYAICGGGTYTLSTAVASSVESILWTSSGTGTFSNATVQNPTYTPSQNDLDDGSVILTITGTSGASCVNANDHMILTFSKQAVVAAGADAIICETATYDLAAATQSNTVSLLWTTSGTGTFSNPTSINPVYTPGSSDIAAGTVTLTLTGQSLSPCVSVTDALVLKISKQATANAGIDYTICEGTIYTLSSATATNATSILWTSSGTGVFSNATTLNPTYTASQNDLDDGTITLTLTVSSSAQCVNATDKTVLNFTKQAIVSAGADVTICETETYTLSAATQSFATSVHWTTTGTGIFSNANSLNPVYIPSSSDISSGTVTLKVTAQSATPCTAVTDALVLTISRAATAYAGVDATICEGGTYTLASATLTHAATSLWTSSGTGTFSNPLMLNTTYTPSQNDLDDGSVTLTLTSASVAPCVNATDNMVLNFTKQAIVDAGTDAVICETETYVLSAATQSFATDLLWTTSGDVTSAIVLH